MSDASALLSPSSVLRKKATSTRPMKSFMPARSEFKRFSLPLRNEKRPSARSPWSAGSITAQALPGRWTRCLLRGMSMAPR